MYICGPLAAAVLGDYRDGVPGGRPSLRVICFSDPTMPFPRFCRPPWDNSGVARQPCQH